MEYSLVMSIIWNQSRTYMLKVVIGVTRLPPPSPSPFSAALITAGARGSTCQTAWALDIWRAAHHWDPHVLELCVCVWVHADRDRWRMATPVIFEPGTLTLDRLQIGLRTRSWTWINADLPVSQSSVNCHTGAPGWKKTRNYTPLIPNSDWWS